MAGETHGVDLRQAALDEALKGERPIGEIASEFEITDSTLKTWLREHYGLFPDDPRHHYIEPGGEARASGASSADADDDDNEAREEMAKKKNPREQKDAKTRHKALTEVHKGKRTVSEIAAEVGVHPSTVTYWLRHPLPDDPQPTEKELSQKEKFFTELKNDFNPLRARKLLGVNGTKARIWLEEFKRQRKLEAMAHARKVAAEKRQDPQYQEEMARRRAERKARRQGGGAPEQLELGAASERTLMSPPSQAPASLPAPVSSLVPYRLPQAPQGGGAMADILEECIEERQSLRGMVKLLQREAEQKDRELAAYRKAYGRIQA